MVYLFLAIGALLFIICCKRLDLVPQVRTVVAATRQAHGIISSESLTDQAKELVIQKAAVAMAGSAVLILGRGVLCCLVPIAALWLGAQSGAYTMADALAAASGWAFIFGSSLVMIAALMVMAFGSRTPRTTGLEGEQPAKMAAVGCGAVGHDEAADEAVPAVDADMALAAEYRHRALGSNALGLAGAWWAPPARQRAPVPSGSSAIDSGAKRPDA